MKGSRWSLKKRPISSLQACSKLFRLLKPGNFEPHPKNPHIAQIFTQMGRSEELGTGVNNVFKYSKEYSGSDDIIFNEEDVFITRVPLSPENQKTSTNVTDRVTDRVTDNQQKILDHINAKQDITTAELSELIGISQRKIKENISKLKAQRILQRIGPAKGGHWKVLK